MKRIKESDAQYAGCILYGNQQGTRYFSQSFEPSNQWPTLTRPPHSLIYRYPSRPVHLRWSPGRRTERRRQFLDPLSYEEYNLGDSTATQIAPAVADHGVYVPDRDAFVKLALDTGEVQWRVDIDTPYAASVVDDDRIIQTGWHETVAVDQSGAVRWRRYLHSRAAAAVADGDVYVAAGDLHELDAENGETNWQAHLPSEGTAAPVVTDQDVLVASGDVRAFRREDGGGILSPDRKRWQISHSAVHAAAYSSPVVAAGRISVAGPPGLQGLKSTKE